MSGRRVNQANGRVTGAAEALRSGRYAQMSRQVHYSARCGCRNCRRQRRKAAKR
jgi:hypothetical protein